MVDDIWMVKSSIIVVGLLDGEAFPLGVVRIAAEVSLESPEDVQSIYNSFPLSFAYFFSFPL